MAYPRITGGNIITYYSGNVFYTVHTFTTSGSVTFLSNVNVDYLVLGGGGAGGRNFGGGGGAGGFVSGSANILAGTYTVTVGAGGSNGTIQAGNGSYGNNGSNSSIGFSTTITGIGGGGGGYYTLSNGQFDGLAGGSGGGAPGTGTGQGKVGGAAQQPGSSSGGFGFAGGNSFAQDNAGAAGGGGGAGAAGSNGASNTGGAGGAGRSTTISGFGAVYGGGGGGAANTTLGAGGYGGGGAAGSVIGANGTPNRGAGGGGTTSGTATATAGQGGSGIVIIRYGLTTNAGAVGSIGGIGSTYAGGGGGSGFTLTSDELFELNSLPGLAGKFFNGSWRSTLSTGNVGTLPLTTVNDSSNVTNITGLPSTDHRYGVKVWPTITYANIGLNYGFMAVGYFKPPTTGTYTFYTLSDDYSGVWVGNIASDISGRTTTNAVVNNGMGGTAGQGNTKVSGTISLTANIWYPVRIVHEQGTGADTLFFSWSGPNIAETFDLQTYFRTPVTSAIDIIGNYTAPLALPTYSIPTGGSGALGGTLLNGSSGIFGGAGGGGSNVAIGGGGGGLGIWGKSTSGAGGPAGSGSGNVIIVGINTSPGSDGDAITGNGGLYGGGGGGYVTSSYDATIGNGAGGALMIVWSNETNVSTVSYPQLANVATNATGAVIAANATNSPTVGKVSYLTGDVIAALQVLENTYGTSRTGNLLSTASQVDGISYPVQSTQTLEFFQTGNLYKNIVVDNDIFSTAANVLRQSLDTISIISTQTVINVDKTVPEKTGNTSVPISALATITVDKTLPEKTGNSNSFISSQVFVTVNTPALVTGNISANNVVAGQSTVTIYNQEEWMLLSSDPGAPVDYNTTYNYTIAKPVTKSNDPRNRYLKANYLQKDVTGQSPKDPQEYL